MMTTSTTLRRVSRIHRRRFLTSSRRSTNAPVDIHPEVEDALAHSKPVVALESTIITHGMPYPTSLDMAQSVESIVRSTGSVPATIAIIGGRVKIGLELRELERLARRTANPMKISRRDISAAIVSGRDGGTTCSSTLIFAALAGIRVFATGGLGGVHRGGETSMDVSADLHELARCPVGLVSAGVKSILDIGRTLEYLETLGVPVVSYGESKDFPAFYTRQSGHQAPWNVTDPAQAAGILYTHWQLGMTNGALFAVPIPEKYEAAGASIQRTVELAVRESEELGISKSGKEVTPWLLNRVKELTKGGSLDSNVALIQNTALVGGKIAVEFVKLAQEGKQDLKRLYLGIKQQPALSSCMDQVTERLSHLDRNVEAIQQNKASIVVVGCAAVDITSKVEQGSVVSSKTTHPGILSLTLGGVGRNIAEAAHRILSGFKEHSNSTLLLAPVGEDIFGKLIVDLTRSTGMRTDGLRSVPGMRSAVCNLFLDAQGGLQNGVADMDLPQLWQGTDVIPILQHHQPQFLVLDGNLSTEMMTAFVKEVAKSDIQIFFEPTSVAKSTRIFPAIAANFGHSLDSVISYASPNLLELRHMYEEARNTFDLMSHDHWWKVVNGFALEPKFRIALDHLAKKAVSEENTNLGDLAFLVDKGVIQMAINLLPFFQHLVIKCGELGVVIVMRLKNADASAWLSKQNDPQGRHVIAYSQASVSTIVVQHFPPLHSSPSASENTTGVGDSLVGALLAMLVQKPNAFLDPATLKSVVDVSQEAAIMTLQSSHAVSPLLSSLSVGLIPGKTSLPPA